MPEGGEIVVLQLPSTGTATDDALQDVANNIFRTGSVRSVTFDLARTTAAVRFDRGAKKGVFDEDAANLLGSFAVSLPAEIPAAHGAVESELLSWVDPRDGSIAFVRRPARVRGWRKALYLAAAAAALALGLLGIVLPGLPTTPFVLLGSFFLIRSSARLHERLMGSRLFGSILHDWHVYRGIRSHVRVKAVAIVAIVVAASLVVARPPWPAVLAIALLAACGLTVIWRLPSVRETPS